MDERCDVWSSKVAGSGEGGLQSREEVGRPPKNIFVNPLTSAVLCGMLRIVE